MEHSTGSHTKFHHRYHIVWSPKYRYKVLIGEVRLRVREIIRQVCGEMGVTIVNGALAALRCEAGEDHLEHSQPAPADETVLDRLVWAIILGRVAPAQTVADHEDAPADRSPIINSWHPVRQRNIRLDPAHLRLRQPDQTTLGSASSRHH